MEDICKEIALEIRWGHFSVDGYSGFTHDGERAVAQGMKKFAEELKREIKAEILAELAAGVE